MRADLWLAFALKIFENRLKILGAAFAARQPHKTWNLKFTTDSNGFLIEFECFDPDLSPDYEPGFGNFSNIMWQKAIDRIILSNDQESFTINYTEDDHKSNLHFDEVFKTIETRWAEIVSE